MTAPGGGFSDQRAGSVTAVTAGDRGAYLVARLRIPIGEIGLADAELVEQLVELGAQNGQALLIHLSRNRVLSETLCPVHHPVEKSVSFEPGRRGLVEQLLHDLGVVAACLNRLGGRTFGTSGALVAKDARIVGQLTEHCNGGAHGAVVVVAGGTFTKPLHPGDPDLRLRRLVTGGAALLAGVGEVFVVGLEARVFGAAAEELGFRPWH